MCNLGAIELMASAEPQRTAPYSPDTGWRVVWLKINQDFSFKDISKRLQIGVGTAHRLFKRFKQTGDVRPLRRGSRPGKRKLDNHHELYIIAEYPSSNLREICQKLEEAIHVTVSWAYRVSCFSQEWLHL